MSDTILNVTRLPLHKVTESLLLPSVLPTASTQAEATSLALMTDFLMTPATSIFLSDNLVEAQRKMRQSGTGLLIVVSELSCVMGVIEAGNVIAELNSQLDGDWESLPSQPQLVDIFVPLRNLEVLSLDSMLTATPAQLLDALQRNARNHLFVVESSSTRNTGRLRGVVLLSQIEQFIRTVHPAVQDIL